MAIVGLKASFEVDLLPQSGARCGKSVGNRLFEFAGTFLETALTLLQGCASRPINQLIAHAEPESGYSVVRHVAQRPDHDPSTLLVLAFSGGGTRVAPFSYGVLEELRRTPIVIDGHQRRMLDEVDIITSVSCGSFTVLAYALYGDRLFSEYESRFLKRNVQGELIGRAVNPFDWPRLLSPGYGRSELAAAYYDEILFDGATFGDLVARPTPVAMPSATDLVTGDRFPFQQDNFNLICSNCRRAEEGRGRVLRASPAYRRLVQALGGTVVESSTDVSQ